MTKPTKPTKPVTIKQHVYPTAKATVEVGSSPFFYNYKRPDKRSVDLGTKGSNKEAPYQYSIQGGFRTKTMQDYWDKTPKKGSSRMVEIKTLEGGKAKRQKIGNADYQDFFWYHREDIMKTGVPATGSGNDDDFIKRDIGEIQDYVAEGFTNTKMNPVKGVGHIVLLEYSTTRWMMRVTFRDQGAVVVYFRVPLTVFLHLKYLAESGQTRLDDKGVPRHALGMEFWNIVRQRGQRTGSKFLYHYDKENVGSRAPGDYSSRYEQEEYAREEQYSRAMDENGVGNYKGWELSDLDQYTNMIGSKEDLDNYYKASSSLKDKYDILKKYNVI
jgi:hypothetical protein